MRTILLLLPLVLAARGNVVEQLVWVGRELLVGVRSRLLVAPM